MTGSHQDPDEGGPWDPGLQIERTSLAWQRTGLAAAVASLVALRGGILVVSPVAAALAVAALAMTVGAAVAGRREVAARTAALRTGRPLPRPVAVRPLAAAVCLVGASALVTLVR